MSQPQDATASAASSAASSETMIAALLRPQAYDHPTAAIELLQTHSAWVILSGPYAYKIKKPVNFGFLDFSTLALRQHDSEEELRLNRRLAPDLYLDLKAVHGPPEQASLQGEGPVIDVAVRMRQFDQNQLLSAVVARGELQAEAIDALAEELAAFQRQAAVAPASGPFGSPAMVRAPVDDNIAVLQSELSLAPPLGALRNWIEQEYGRLEDSFQQRLEQGRIREGHGDLHLGNMVLEDGRIRVFDCLEFNPSLRWIDVISEMAFLVMDLDSRGCGSLAIRLLNRWLEISGDYGGLRSWRWYSVYRALVRAKVAHLRAHQISEVAGLERDRYLKVAELWTAPRP
ncbi:MAG: phosphotransferase, partial [Prochlorococcaceae cyanobacterium]